MKKTLSIASLLAMILSVAIFTSCSEPEPYTGKFYNTEYVTNISDDEYNQNWEKQNWETRSKYLATWPEKEGYEKKTNLKDYEVVSYLKSKWLLQMKLFKTIYYVLKLLRIHMLILSLKEVLIAITIYYFLQKQNK